MSPRVSLGIVVVAIAATVSVGCTVDAKNFTPPEQPWDFVRDNAALLTALYPASTPNEVRDLVTNQPGHRFLLELKPRNVSNVSASVTINGTEYPMQRYAGGTGGGTWHATPPSECNATYTYNFRIRYSAGLFGSQAYTLGDPTPFTATVTGFGTPIGYVPPFGPTVLGAGVLPHINVGFATSNPRTVVIQNLRSNPIQVQFIYMDTSPIDSPDATQFQLTNTPALPVDLVCGGKLAFQVAWLAAIPPGATQRAVVRVVTRFLDAAGNLTAQGWTFEVRLSGSIPT